VWPISRAIFESLQKNSGKGVYKAEMPPYNLVSLLIAELAETAKGSLKN